VKIVGLNIEKGRLGVTVVQRQFGKTELLDSFARTYDTDADLAAILREQSAAWAGARIVSAVPGRHFTQRMLQFPFSDRKRIEKAVPFEFEDLVPFDLGNLLLDHLVLEDAAGKEPGARVLALALPKPVLRQHLDLLMSAGIEPQAVVPSFAGLAAVAKLLPADGMALLMNDRDVCLMTGGVVRSLRSISTSASGGIRQVLQAIETEQKERVERAVLITADDEARAFLAEAGVASELVVPELGGKRVTDAGSLGTALAAGVNFRKGEFAYRLADEGSRRRKRTLIIAAAAAAVLFGANIAVKMSIVRAGYGRLDAEIREIYRQTFPEARQAGDPVRQMRDKLTEAKRLFGALGTSSSALDVMKTVTDGIPKEIRVSFSEFNLEGDRLRLQGEAASFETVDMIKAELAKSPLFAEVTVQDTRMGVDNKVKFRFEIKLKQAM
jgi:type II secretion system protein L